MIPCTYILYGKQLDRPHVRSELKNSRKKRTCVEDCGSDQDRKRKDCELTVSYFVICFVF